MNVINSLEFVSKDLTLLIIQSNKSNNKFLYELLSGFFNKSKNITFCKDENISYEKNKYDLIVCDITSNEEKYLNILKNIRNIDKEQSVIVINELLKVDNILSLINMGIHQFVSTPIKTEELQYRLLKSCELVFYKKFYQENNSQDVSLYLEDVLEQKKMNSKQFEEYLKVNNISYEKFEKLTESLLSLNNMFSKCIEKLYINKLSDNLLENIIEIIESIVSKFQTLGSLKKLSDVLNEFIDFLEKIELDKLSNSQINNLKIIEFIYDDVSRYINTVFIYKDTVDIHYLEDSLRSSIIQLRQNVLNEKIEEEDLEIF